MRIVTQHLSTEARALIAASINPDETFTEATEADREEFWGSVEPDTTLEAKHRSTVSERPLVIAVDPPVEMLAASEHPDRRPGISVPTMGRDFFPTHIPLNRG